MPETPFRSRGAHYHMGIHRHQHQQQYCYCNNCSSRHQRQMAPFVGEYGCCSNAGKYKPSRGANFQHRYDQQEANQRHAYCSHLSCQLSSASLSSHQTKSVPLFDNSFPTIQQTARYSTTNHSTQSRPLHGGISPQCTAESHSYSLKHHSVPFHFKVFIFLILLSITMALPSCNQYLGCLPFITTVQAANLESDSAAGITSPSSFLDGISFTFLESDATSTYNIVVYSLAGALVLNCVLLCFLSCCLICIVGSWCACRIRKKRRNSHELTTTEKFIHNQDDAVEIEMKKAKSVVQLQDTQMEAADGDDDASAYDPSTPEPLLNQNDIIIMEQNDTEALLHEEDQDDASITLQGETWPDHSELTEAELRAKIMSKKVQISEEHSQLDDVEFKVSKMQQDISRLEQEVRDHGNIRHLSSLSKERANNVHVRQHHTQHQSKLSEGRLQMRQLMWKLFSEIDSNEQLRVDIGTKRRRLEQQQIQNDKLRDTVSQLQGDLQEQVQKAETQGEYATSGGSQLEFLQDRFSREQESHQEIISSLEKELYRLQGKLTRLQETDK